jgi:hypothetical protein
MCDSQVWSNIEKANLSKQLLIHWATTILQLSKIMSQILI